MMRTNVYALAAAAVLACTTAAGAALPNPPDAKRVPVTDTYFGTAVTDPYRWMETGGPEFQAFLKSHNDRTRAALDSIPARAAFAARLQALSETSNVSSGEMCIRDRRYVVRPRERRRVRPAADDRDETETALGR